MDLITEIGTQTKMKTLIIRKDALGVGWIHEEHSKTSSIFGNTRRTLEERGGEERFLKARERLQKIVSNEWEGGRGYL